jgi:hypothetical protein
MRPHGSDLLKADRLKAGGIKPGTWALNHMNAMNFSGVLASPFFGQPTAAAPPRRVEIGIRVTF